MDGTGIGEAYVEALDRRDWAQVVELLDPNVVYEMPQTGERITGRDRYVQFNREYPGDWHLRPRVAIEDDGHGVVWFDSTVNGTIETGIAFFTFADGRITSVTDFWPEPYDPPPGREHLTEAMD